MCVLPCPVHARSLPIVRGCSGRVWLVGRALHVHASGGAACEAALRLRRVANSGVLGGETPSTSRDSMPCRRARDGYELDVGCVCGADPTRFVLSF